jgi:hypothetical protein
VSGGKAYSTTYTLKVSDVGPNQVREIFQYSSDPGAFDEYDYRWSTLWIRDYGERHGLPPLSQTTCTWQPPLAVYPIKLVVGASWSVSPPATCSGTGPGQPFTESLGAEVRALSNIRIGQRNVTVFEVDESVQLQGHTDWKVTIKDYLSPAYGVSLKKVITTSSGGTATIQVTSLPG